jgi:hypothetical protein
MIQTRSSRCDLFESSHGEVFCCAKNETSVVIIRCCSNSHKKTAEQFGFEYLSRVTRFSLDR